MAAAACTVPEDPQAEADDSPVSTASPGGGSAFPSHSGRGDEVPCSAFVDAIAEPPADYRIVVEDVAVPDREVLQAAERGGDAPATRLFAKWGLVVRVGAVVDLQVAPGWEDKARLEWGAQPEAASVRVHACASPKTGGQPWLAFAGGTWVAAPACVPLTIRSGKREVQVHLPIGVPCDGDSSGPPS